MALFAYRVCLSSRCRTIALSTSLNPASPVCSPRYPVSASLLLVVSALSHYHVYLSSRCLVAALSMLFNLASRSCISFHVLAFRCDCIFPSLRFPLIMFTRHPAALSPRCPCHVISRQGRASVSMSLLSVIIAFFRQCVFPLPCSPVITLHCLPVFHVTLSRVKVIHHSEVCKVGSRRPSNQRLYGAQKQI